MSKAIVLLSGGIDSSTVLALAKSEGYDPHALTVRYGQRHGIEEVAAHYVAASLGVFNHEFINIPLDVFGGSALTDKSIAVPKDRDESEMSSDIPVTYVPGRNLVMLSLALAYAEAIGAGDIFIGVNAVDYSGYPDCRPEFIEAFEGLAKLATREGVEGSRFEVHAPLVSMTKVEIIELGLKLGVDYSLTHSCYDPILYRETKVNSWDTSQLDHVKRWKVCGRCDSCLIRQKAFAELGMVDPALTGNP